MIYFARNQERNTPMANEQKIAAIHVLGNEAPNRVAIVRYMEGGYYPQPQLDNSLLPDEQIALLVGELNSKLGVPYEVAQSMKMASMFGWNAPAAARARAFFEGR